MAEGFVEFHFGFDVHPMSDSRVAGAAQVGFLPIDINVGNPDCLSFVLNNPLKSGFVFTLKLVLSIFARRNDPQISPSVIISDPIPMVNHAFWHRPGHVQERHPMSPVPFPVRSKVNIPVRCTGDDLSNLTAHVVSGNKACEVTRFRVIVENLFKPLLIHWLKLLDLHTVCKVV